MNRAQADIIGPDRPEIRARGSSRVRTGSRNSDPGNGTAEQVLKKRRWTPEL